NLRTLPGAEEKEIIRHIEETIDNDHIKIRIRPNKTSFKQIADINHPSFNYLQKTISAFKEDIVVAPFLMIGATDSRYFSDLTSQVFKFIPFPDVEGLHGVNERIKATDYKEGITFYYYFIKDLY
ncbi:M20/M25/M40 family metallo-hydrolase, partial [Pseudoxanthomonas sp. SGD-10]